MHLCVKWKVYTRVLEASHPWTAPFRSRGRVLAETGILIRKEDGVLTVAKLGAQAWPILY